MTAPLLGAVLLCLTVTVGSQPSPTRNSLGPHHGISLEDIALTKYDTATSTDPASTDHGTDALNIAPYGATPVYIANKPKAPVAIKFWNRTMIVLDELEHTEPHASSVNSLVVEASLDINLWIIRELHLRACVSIESAVANPRSGKVEHIKTSQAKCFSTQKAQNVTVPALSAGKHKISVAVFDPLGDQVGPSSQVVSLTVSASRLFRPTYDWQFVHSWQTVPTGMQIKLAVDGSGDRLAKIPDPWRLQVYLGNGEGFFRGSIRRSWTPAQIRAAISKDKSIPIECVSLDMEVVAEKSANDLLDLWDPAATVESLLLFERKEQVRAFVNRSISHTCLCAGSIKCAHSKRIFKSCSKNSQSACSSEKADWESCNTICGVKSDAELAEEKRLKKLAKKEAEMQARGPAPKQASEQIIEVEDDEIVLDDTPHRIDLRGSRSNHAEDVSARSTGNAVLQETLVNAQLEALSKHDTQPDVSEDKEWSKILMERERQRLLDVGALGAESYGAQVPLQLDVASVVDVSMADVEADAASLFADIADEEDDDEIVDLTMFAL